VLAKQFVPLAVIRGKPGLLSQKELAGPSQQAVSLLPGAVLHDKAGTVLTPTRLNSRRQNANLRFNPRKISGL